MPHLSLRESDAQVRQTSPKTDSVQKREKEKFGRVRPRRERFLRLDGVWITGSSDTT